MPKRFYFNPLIILFLLIFSLVTSCSHAFSAEHDERPAATALILFDESTQWKWIGHLHSIFLANLLGHFHQSYRILAVDQYTKGLISQFDTIFYFGVSYNHPLCETFIQDVLETTRDVVWFKYNLWQLSKHDVQFSQKYGFQFDSINTTEHDTIWYKDTALKKNNLDKELGKITIHNAERVQVIATAQETLSKQKTPYIIHSQNLWYIADIPFAFADENSSYLALADILYDILHIKTEPQKRALLRLEDIDPTYNTELLKSFADYLYEQHIPFSISVIPYYQDPLHIIYETPQFIKISENPEFIEALKYMISKGGSIILHGYTHQYANIANPYSGTSGADYEFARVIFDPNTFKITKVEDIPEDSKEWVSDRIMRAETLMEQAGFKTHFWETPHYTASYIDNQFFAEHFQATLGRVEYYDPEDLSHHANQFFPYIINQDVYGQKVIPENLGCFSPIPWFNYPKRDIQDILMTAKKNLVIRDGWASVYYHPFLGLADLKTIVSEIKTLGYEFVSIQD